MVLSLSTPSPPASAPALAGQPAPDTTPRQAHDARPSSFPLAGTHHLSEGGRPRVVTSMPRSKARCIRRLRTNTGHRFGYRGSLCCQRHFNLLAPRGDLKVALETSPGNCHSLLCLPFGGFCSSSSAGQDRKGHIQDGTKSGRMNKPCFHDSSTFVLHTGRGWICQSGSVMGSRSSQDFINPGFGPAQWRQDDDPPVMFDYWPTPKLVCSGSPVSSSLILGVHMDIIMSARNRKMCLCCVF
ncbi:hypothetical protein B0T21DRAFT_47249 [Apiosordaria backusii]|uniref:Uncharacterized protein n=1 Tax=Apiosordaria backusii TaxID=314023 RepID=A0AA40E113_9PEZI|nr:hypothetical protein B0T21DRAFT_47249 [Apiosordaria backusii]